MGYMACCDDDATRTYMYEKNNLTETGFTTRPSFQKNEAVRMPPHQS
jgi:hypothetical protein